MQYRNIYKPYFPKKRMRKNRKEEIKKMLTKEWQSTNRFAEYKGKHSIAYKLLQELVDIGFAEKIKLERITYWRKK